jgi:hypothetical protein
VDDYVLVDHSAMRLGRKAVKRDSRTLKFASYVDAGVLPAAPINVDYMGATTDWGMMCNDDLGCCTIAGGFHLTQFWSNMVHNTIPSVPDSIITSYYSKWDGYNPADPSTDNGGVELDVLNDWKLQTLNGIPIIGFVSVDFTDQTQVQQAMWLFGGLYIGIELPVSAQNQALWDAVSGHDGKPGGWGGHCVAVGKSTMGGNKTCVTWGAPKDLTEAFWAKYVDECWVALSPAWIASDKTVSPNGFGLADLQRDLACIR